MVEKRNYFCRYSNVRCDDSGIEALKIYLPADDGFVNYNIVHSVMESTKCDMWRLSAVYFCDEEFKSIRPLTRCGAEWEMALKIKGRPDFIGGYAHGDEVFERISLKIDGETRTLSELWELVSFNELSFEVWSRGYDPIDSEGEALLHYKNIIVDEKGIRVEQKVDWLASYELENSFMAMFPPLKSETDFYFTGNCQERRPIPEILRINGGGDLNEVGMCGNSGFTFSMKVPKYLTDENGHNNYYLSDNGGVPYNKMYFSLQHGGAVDKGDVWETVTEYKIVANELKL